MRTLLLGFGNPDREDDGAAWHILTSLAKALHLPAPATLEEDFAPLGGETDFLFTLQLTPELAETIAAYQAVYFIDAHTGHVPQDLYITPLQADFQNSPLTHHLTPQSCLALAATLYHSQPQAELISVRGYAFGFSNQLSASTRTLAEQAIQYLLQKLNPDTPSHPTESFTFWQYTPEGPTRIESQMAVEQTVSLTVNGDLWLNFQCTPDRLEALAIGFLFNEGFIHTLNEIANIHVCDRKDNVDVWLTHATSKPATWRRTSGCHGGSTSQDLQRDQIHPVTSTFCLPIAQIFQLVEAFLDGQTPHHQSGGVHTSSLADGNRLLFHIEDIGRHNTFDKIAGQILLSSLHINTPILLTSGRISSDMLQKAVRLQAPIVISMRSTSSIGIRLAEEWGITLIGSARRGRFNVYAHSERIKQG